eukprot:scaffold58107_cov70-Cyclotella_meneghiniana.AAC.6
MHVYPFYPLPGKRLYPRVLSMRLYPDVTAQYHKSRSLDIWLNVKLREGVDRDEMKAVIWRFAATLSKTTDRIRSNIIPLQSNYYPKQWAVKMVMSRDIYASD